jgi:hypothetical protein
MPTRTVRSHSTTTKPTRTNIKPGPTSRADSMMNDISKTQEVLKQADSVMNDISKKQEVLKQEAWELGEGKKSFERKGDSLEQERNLLKRRRVMDFSAPHMFAPIIHTTMMVKAPPKTSIHRPQRGLLRFSPPSPWAFSPATNHIHPGRYIPPSQRKLPPRIRSKVPPMMSAGGPAPVPQVAEPRVYEE